MPEVITHTAEKNTMPAERKKKPAHVRIACRMNAVPLVVEVSLYARVKQDAAHREACSTCTDCENFSR